MGAHHQAEIMTWYPQKRMASSVPFTWEADKWYTMKLRSSVENGQAVLRARIWPRGETEPAEWTVEATDPVPNRNGSPGLRADATNAEIFYDNIKVYPNESTP
jgi:hypothetical protein